VAEFFSPRVCLSHSVDPLVPEHIVETLDHFDSGFLCSHLDHSTTLDLLSEDLIGRISSAFDDLTGSRLEAIPVSVLFRILCHHLLIISNEDHLFSCINSHICSYPDYSEFLQFIQFEYLTSECVSYFVSTLPDSIDRYLWESVSRRLISRVALDGVEFLLKDGKLFDGIVSYLTQKHAELLMTKELSPLLSQIWIIADLSPDPDFFSTNEPGQ
jgi:hypothetical protein